MVSRNNHGTVYGDLVYHGLYGRANTHEVDLKRTHDNRLEGITA